MYWLGFTLILILGVALLVGAMIFAQRRQATLVTNLLLSLLFFFLTFMAVELFFKLFFAQSDGFRYTLSAQNWYDRYWEENELGYRDVLWTDQQVEGKTKVMVVGDSFVAGTGINDPNDRFSNQLGQLLGDDFVVFNVASPGWDTIDEVRAILEYPYPPDIIVLSYFINDIEGVAYDSGAQRPQVRQDPPAWLNLFVQNSHAVNFIYWRVARLGPQEWARIYWEDWLVAIANDPEIRWRHQQELLTIADGAASEQTPLYVVVFPNLTAVEESEFITQPVIDLFTERNVPVLDVTTILAGRDPAETVVNPFDAHPNEQIHREVAEALYQMITAPTAQE